jgi:hypothetical protein
VFSPFKGKQEDCDNRLVAAMETILKAAYFIEASSAQKYTRPEEAGQLGPVA